MKLKKLFAGLISLAAALLAVCAITVCAGAETSGDYKYSILDDGTVRINRYTGNAKELIIPSTLEGKSVTIIGESAFVNCTSLTSINIPDSVTTIGDYAFCRCSRLTSVDIPNSVTSIAYRAFYDCSNLTSVNIPDGVTDIMGDAFCNCSSLTSIDIPDSVTSIGSYAFYNTPFLDNQTDIVKYAGKWVIDCDENATTATIKSGTVGIADEAFYRCENLTLITIPDSVTSIGEGAFYHCSSLTSINIPDGVTSIEYYAFAYCSYLPSITIPDSVTRIGDGAFFSCLNITSIDIPDSVISIDPRAFKGCTSLTIIKVGKNNKFFASNDGVLFDKDMTTVLICPNGKAGKYNIPNGVKTIEFGAFAGCSSLTSVDIPDGLTSIGDDAFNGCSSLKSITIPDGLTSIGDVAFNGCSSLKSINIPDSVTRIGGAIGGTFYGCTSLISINIPDGVTSIGNGTFYGCSSLTSITIPDSVTRIGYGAFYNTPILNNQTTTVKYVGKWLIDCAENASPTATIKSGTVGIADFAFHFCNYLTSITIPDSVTSIGESAFENCPRLISIDIPDGVTSIEPYTFLYCSSLTSITIPDGVTDIGLGAFKDCTSLASINIPDSVTSIGDLAFENTPLLKNQTTTVKYAGKWVIDCNENATTATMKSDTVGIADHAFCDCSNLTSITIPDSVTSIGKYAFGFCESLTSITIPVSVTSIGDYAFYSCSSLKSINIPDSVTSIGYKAFYGCRSLEDVYYCGSKAQWDNITIGEDNEDLLNATIHYGKHISGDPIIENEIPATCGADGSYDEVVYCEVCGEEISRTPVTVPATGKHTYIDKVVSPTYTAQGYTEHTCSVCGYSYKDTYTAKKTVSAVTGLSLKGRSADALRLSWTKNPSADGYIIEMKDGSKWVRVGKVTKNSTVEFRKAGLKAGTAYSFRVKAYKMDGKTALYSGYTTISARTNPSAISGLKLKARSADALRLTWTKNTSADGYIIEMKSGNSWTRVGKITSNSTIEFKKSGLKAGTAYTFRVKAYKMSGKTALYGATKSISVRTNPSAVSGLKLKARAADAVRLSWTKNTSADGYIVEMKVGGVWKRAGKIAKNSTIEFKKSGLKSKTSYTFRIKSYKMSGKTALYSGYKTITVKTK